MDTAIHDDHRREAAEPLGDSADFSAPAPKGIGRRTLIKRAAIGGALAWTAPVIIDSLASPAAAGTCGVIYRVEIRMDTTCLGVGGTGSFAVGTYDADSCYPNATSGAINLPSGYQSIPVFNVPGGTAPSGGAIACVVLTPSGTNTVKLVANQAAPTASCDSRLNNNVIATINQACTPPGSSLSTCNASKTFIAAGYNWRTSDCGNFARQWSAAAGVTSANSCGENSPTNCNGRGSDGGTNSGSGYANRTIASASGSSITFQQPASDKGPDHSGSYQFVIGCGCTS